jgi:hypothetical protein
MNIGGDNGFVYSVVIGIQHKQVLLLIGAVN